MSTSETKVDLLSACYKNSGLLKFNVPQLRGEPTLCIATICALLYHSHARMRETNTHTHDDAHATCCALSDKVLCL